MPLASLEALNDTTFPVMTAIMQCLNQPDTHKAQLAAVQEAIQDALQDQVLSPHEHMLLVRCAAALQPLDPDNPVFKPLAYPAPPPSQNDSRWQRVVRRIRRGGRG